jgi:hypothetical protein
MLIQYNNQVEEEMLMCKPSRTHNMGKGTLNLMCTQLKKGLNWKQCVDIWKDDT